MKYIFIVLGFVGYLILSSIWYGYVLSIVWRWFIVKAFNAPQISIPVAIGISLVVNMFKNQENTSGKKASEKFAQSMAYAFLLPLFVLGLGYVVHLFV